MSTASQLIPVAFDKIMQAKSYTVIILKAENKQFAIYTAPEVGLNIQRHLTEEQKARPLTHELISSLLQGFNIKLLQIVINDIEDTIYFARLFLEQQIGDQTLIAEVDARPSDCIALALMHNTPVFCKKEILDKAVPVEE